MRTTDPEPQPYRPLGEKVTKPSASPPTSMPKPNERGVVTDADGRMHTNLPLPK
jgi:hypothetical protein